MVRAVPSVQLLGDRYRVVETLSETPRERTVRAEDTHQGNQTRLLWQCRVVLPQQGLRDRAVQLCRQEFDFLQRLQHPQVPRFYDFWSQAVEEQLWLTIVQEDIVGPTLRQWCQQRPAQEPQLSELATVKWLLQVLNGVGYIHTQGVIHRHLSPDHLQLRSTQGRWTLVGFGGMKQALQLLQAEAAGEAKPQQAPAGDWAPLDYAPLEQVQKGIVYTYSDIYAIAATALYTLTGKDPQACRDPQTGAWDWTTTPLTCAELQAVLAQMLAQKPNDRPQNVQSIIHQLRRIPQATLKEETTMSTPPSPETESETQQSALVLPMAPPRPSPATTLRRWSGRLLLGLVIVTGAGALGWGVGQVVLHQRVSNPTPVPELDLSPEVTRAEDAPTDASTQALDFPLVDDGEPDPDPSWTEAEQARRLALREQRRQLGIDYEFFRALVQYAYGQAYSSPSGVLLVVDGTQEREQWDATAQGLLHRLAGLSAEARRRLGRYPQPIRLDNLEAQQLQTTPATFEMVVKALFGIYFPEQAPNSPILKQLWRAIAFEQLNQFRQFQRVEPLTLTPGSTQVTRAEQLAAGQSKIYPLTLAEEHRLTANLVGNSSTSLAVQAPSGELLLELGGDRVWSKRLTEAGTYQFVVLNTAVEPADFQLYLTVE